MVEAYFHNGADVDSVSTFFVQSCLEEQQALNYKNFEGTLKLVGVLSCFAKLEVLGVKLIVDDHQLNPRKHMQL